MGSEGKVEDRVCRGVEEVEERGQWLVAGYPKPWPAGQWVLGLVSLRAAGSNSEPFVSWPELFVFIYQHL